jgi:hypothetical protein
MAEVLDAFAAICAVVLPLLLVWGLFSWGERKRPRNGRHD